MRSARLALAGAALMFAAAVPTTAASATTARPTTSDHASALQTRIDQVVAANPGARQISSTEVRLDEHATVAFPAPGTTTTGTGGCDPDALCLYQHADYEGSVLRLTCCGWYDLSRYKMRPDDPTTFANNISSWWDNRTGAFSFTFLFDGNWKLIGRTDQPRHEHYVGDSRNDATVHLISLC